MGIKHFCHFVLNHTNIPYVNMWSLPPPNVHPLQRHFITQMTENLSENELNVQHFKFIPFNPDMTR